MTRHDLQRILVGSRARNRLADVTGLLIFIGGRFTQYLEGPTDGLERIFRLVRASPLHDEVVLVGGRRAIHERRYAEWSMAFFADGGDDAGGGETCGDSIVRGAAPEP